jgi:hypothetical protein
MTLYHCTPNGNIPFTAEEQAQWETEQAEYLASVDERAADDVRKERDVKLTSCDWTQVVDAPVNQTAWATYRQALRDIPSQAGFPNTVNWPTEPEV